MNGNSLPVFAVFSPGVASLGLVSFVHLVVAAAHSIPHPWVLGSWQNCPAVVIKSIVVHVLQLVCLAQPIPRPEIFRINFNRIPIGLYSSRDVLHFKILVTHEGPSSQAGSVKFQSLSEVDDSFKMLTHERVVITNDTTCFRNILIIIKLLQSKISKFPLVFFNIKNIRIRIHIFKSKRINFQ